MIRLLFVIFVTLGGFAAAALWAARGGDAGDVAAEVVPGALRAAVDSAESLRSAVQSQVERLRTEADAAAPEPAAAATPAARSESVPAADGAEPGPSPEPLANAEPATEVRDLSLPDEFPLDTGGDVGTGPDAAGPESTETPEDALWFGAAPAPVLPDPDESADLIRRMLAVYRQTGPRK